MKLISLLVLLSFMSCTHYQTSSISKNRVMVAKNINVLGIIQFGEVYTCQTDNTGRIDTCIENKIEDNDAKQARLARQEEEKRRRDAFNLRSY